MYELVAEFGSVTWGNGSDIKQRRRREREGKKLLDPELGEPRNVVK